MIKNLLSFKFVFLTLFILFISIQGHASDSTGSLINWSTDRMRIWSSPGKSGYADAQESEIEAIERYQEIAEAASEVAYDPSEAPLYSGSIGRAQTLALLLSIASFESGGFSKNVDLGIGAYANGDHGNSWCMMQVRLSTINPLTNKTYQRVALKDDVIEYTTDPTVGFGGEDLIADRVACFRVGLHAVRMSFKACAQNIPLYRLAVYTSGKCDTGHTASSLRITRAMNWLSITPPPFEDEIAMGFFNPSID